MGNLVAVGGRLISQTATEIRSFRPREEVWQQLTRDLETDPANPAALAARGEFRLHDGETDLGLTDFRSVLEQTDDPRSRHLLVSTLLEGLRADFASFRTHVEELDRLSVTPRERGEFLATYAHGLLDADDPAGAFEQYIRLLAETDDERPFAYVAEGRQVRRDRFALGQLARIYEAAADDLRLELDGLIGTALSQRAGEDIASLHEQLAAALPHYRDTRPDRSRLQDGPDESEPPTKAEARLIVALRRGDPDGRAAAAAELVEFYARHGRAEPVVQLLNHLETVWADASCLDELTGAEWAAAARERDHVSMVLQTAVIWPAGEISVENETGNPVLDTAIRFEGPIDPLIATHLYLSDRNAQNVTIQDGLGRPIKGGELSVPNAGGPIQPVRNTSCNTAIVRSSIGGTHFKLIDLIGGEPRVLLEDMLVDVEPVTHPQFRMMRSSVTQQSGFRGQVRWSNDPGETGSVGPLNDAAFCYLKGKTLQAHDPFTGERLWTVEDAPAGAEIFADSDYVVLVPIGKLVAHIYRALDGEKLGSVRNLPRDVQRNRRGADWGRLFLRHFKDDDGTEVIAMFDPVSGENVWTRRLESLSLWAPLDGRDLCLLDFNGRMQLVAAETGRVLQEADVDVPAGMASMSVLSLPDQWLITTCRRPTADATTQLAQVRMSQSALPRHQRAGHCLRATNRQTVVESERRQSVPVHSAAGPMAPPAVLGGRQCDATDRRTANDPVSPH